MIPCFWRMNADNNLNIVGVSKALPLFRYWLLDQLGAEGDEPSDPEQPITGKRADHVTKRNTDLVSCD